MTGTQLRRPRSRPSRSSRPPSGWRPSGTDNDFFDPRRDRPSTGEPMMQVSHETIYQALFVKGCSELRREFGQMPG